METQEMKQRIKDYFVEIKEDKFTKVKTIKCKHKIEWKGKELENKFMLTKDSYSNSLSMSIDYRHKDDVDSVFFGFTYSNSDGGYPGMTNIKMYLMLDDDKTIELSEGSGFDHASQSSKVGDNYISVYIETAQLAVSVSDFIAIANAKKIEYSIRFGQGSMEGTFNEKQNLIFKGVYNSSFDDQFELELIQKSIKGEVVLSDILIPVETYLNLFVKTNIDLENFRFSPRNNERLELSNNESAILAVFSNSTATNLCDLVITNKRLFYYVDLTFQVKSIELSKGMLFDSKKNWLGVEKLIESKTSFSKMITVGGLAKGLAEILNNLVKNISNE
jgi:hypothetical protein